MIKKILKVLFLACVGISANIYASNRLEVVYNEIQVFDGHIVEMTDGYNVRTDKNNTHYIAIKLDKPIDVKEERGSDFNAGESNVKVMQLVPMFDDIKYENFKNMVGQKVKVIGIIYHRDNANQMTPILLITYQIVDPKNFSYVNKDEINVVYKFYNALSSGNGLIANNYVIQEKRNKANYDIKAMSKFYGNMTAPLYFSRLIINEGHKFDVFYNYTKTKSQCNGIARVETKKEGEKYYISSIKANC